MARTLQLQGREDTHLRLQGQSACNSGQKQLEKNEAALMIQNHKADVQQGSAMPSLQISALGGQYLGGSRRRAGSRSFARGGWSLPVVTPPPPEKGMFSHWSQETPSAQEPV